MALGYKQIASGCMRRNTLVQNITMTCKHIKIGLEQNVRRVGEKGGLAPAPTTQSEAKTISSVMITLPFWAERYEFIYVNALPTIKEVEARKAKRELKQIDGETVDQFTTYRV